MRLLDGVDGEGVHPTLWLFLGAIAERHRYYTQAELVITSLRRPAGPRPSLHSPRAGELVMAADIRRHALDRDESAARFCRIMQNDWGDYLGVVLEPEWLTPREVALRGGLAAIGPHIHVQLKTPALPRRL